MGLDVYVGTLTRYYAGQWETAVQQAGREMGISVDVVREYDPPDALRDPREIERIVLAWRDGLNRDLGTHSTAPLVWSEGLGPPYFTDKPAWDCYSALLVWAAHEEHDDPELPPTAPDDWTTDRAVARSQSSTSRYGQLLYGVELWLPGDFGFTFRAPDASGHPITIGSVQALHAQLRDLNSRTWRADESTLVKWRREGAEYGAPLEQSARLGFTVFSQLVAAAAVHGLPMKLDY